MTTSKEWQGRVGQVWADQAVALDAMLAPMGDIGLDAMADVSRQTVLDIGCGAGDSCVVLAKRGAKVLGVDISDDLLAVARDRSSGMDAQFLLGDAGQVELPLSVDQIYSRFGCMFFDNPSSAWAHLHGQVAEGTPMTLVAWGAVAANDWASLPVALAKDILGSDSAKAPVNGEMGPFAWADPSDFVDMLRDAGWQDIVLEKINRQVPCAMGGSDDGLKNGVAFVMTIGRLASCLKGVPRETRVKVREALTAHLGDFVVDGVLMFNASAWLIKARA